MPLKHTNREFEEELQRIRSLIVEMTETVQAMLQDSLQAFQRGDTDLAARVIEADRRVDRLEMETDEQCLRVLSLLQPLGSDLRFVATSLKAVTDIERIGDLCVSICERTAELAAEPAREPLADVAAMGELARAMVERSMQALLRSDVDLARVVMDEDRQVDALYAQAVRQTLNFLATDPGSVSWASRVQAVAKYLERIGDHATNLSEMVVFMVRGQDIRHGESLAEAVHGPRGILFLCVHNAARSQMAEGWARQLLPPDVAVWSAGSDPATAIDARAVAVMKEIGIDIAAQRPKRISDVPLSRADIVVTLCAEEVCMALPGLVRRENWILPDPAAARGDSQQVLAEFRRIRDDLRQRIAALAQTLTPSSA